MTIRVLMSISVLIFFLVGCASESDPVPVVEAYLEAKVSSDADQIRALICDELEATISQEIASFSTIEAELNVDTCTRRDGDNVVECTGTIDATYGDEVTEFPLTAYRVVQTDGEWRWCGVSQ